MQIRMSSMAWGRPWPGGLRPEGPRLTAGLGLGVRRCSLPPESPPSGPPGGGGPAPLAASILVPTGTVTVKGSPVPESPALRSSGGVVGGGQEATPTWVTVVPMLVREGRDRHSARKFHDTLISETDGKLRHRPRWRTAPPWGSGLKLKLQLHLGSGSDARAGVTNSCLRSLKDPPGPERLSHEALPKRPPRGASYPRHQYRGPEQHPGGSDPARTHFRTARTLQAQAPV